MQARYYDPVIGRFYSNDPVDALGHIQRGNSIAHGFNRYTYANNNPYKYVDPDGKFGYHAALLTQEEAGRQALGKIAKASTLKVGYGPGAQVTRKIPGVVDLEVGYSAAVSVVLSADEAPKIELSATGGGTLSNQTGTVKIEGKVADI